MRHLHADELIDLAEGARAEASAPHLQTCDACRRQLADVRAMMAAAAEVDVPEPSPLFWGHFSARVHQAIASEGAPPPVGWFEGRLWSRPAVALSLAAFATIVIAAIVTARLGRVSPVTAPSLTPATATADAALPAEPTELADDPSLDLVANLTEDLDWDTAHEGGFAPRQGAVDRAVSQLTDVERRELQRLLKEELARSN